MEATEPTNLIETVLFFRDARLVSNAEFVCASWTEDDSKPRSSPSSSTANMKVIMIQEPIADTFFLENKFGNLVKMDIFPEAFRQTNMLSLPDGLGIPLPNLNCLNVNLVLPTISWAFPEAEEVTLNQNAGKNFITFLNAIGCPNLTSFHLKTNEDKFRDSNWEIQVFKFLKSKKHMKILDLTLGNSLKRQSDCDPFVCGLHDLAPLEILFIQFSSETQYENKMLPLPNYWTLLLNQNHLQYIDLMGVPDITINDIHFLVRRNRATLNVLRYHFIFCESKRKFLLDGEAFESCASLFELTFNPGMCDKFPRQSKSTVLNLHLLPKTLTTLRLANLKLETESLASLENLENLKFLELMHLGCGDGYGISLDAFLALLRLRSIDRLIALPIVITTTAESLKLDEIEKQLQRVDPDAEFLRHLNFYHGEPRDESLGFLLRYCPIV